MLDSPVTRLISDGFRCRDCGHEDNERDPRTGRVNGPPCDESAHFRVRLSGARLVLPVMADLEVVSPRLDLVSWCLICGRPYSGDLEYQVTL